MNFLHVFPKHSWSLLYAFILDSASLVYETHLQSEFSLVVPFAFKAVIRCLSSISSYSNVLYWCLKGEHLFPLFITSLHISGRQMCRWFFTPASSPVLCRYKQSVLEINSGQFYLALFTWSWPQIPLVEDSVQQDWAAPSDHNCMSKKSLVYLTYWL